MLFRRSVWRKAKTGAPRRSVAVQTFRNVQAQTEAVPKIAVRRYGELAEQIHEAICGLEK
jgi:hypothetical protein